MQQAVRIKKKRRKAQNIRIIMFTKARRQNKWELA